jgi:rubrerythrin
MTDPIAETTHAVGESHVGDLFVNKHGNPILIDGDYTVDRNGEAIVTHYHWSEIGDHEGMREAEQTIPEDEGTSWMSVELFEERLSSGELRAATVVPGERYRCDDCGYSWAYSGSADRPTCPSCQGKRVGPVTD